MNGRAELIADGGAAATTSDFFRSREFLCAERVTHSLVVTTNSGRCVLPILVREVPGSLAWDGISPYGYPGGMLDGEPPDPRDVDWSGTGLVSLFLRDRLGSPTLLGGTPRGQVMVYDPLRTRVISKSYRRDVRRNVRNGYTVELLPGRDVDERGFDGFVTAYRETMDRLGADSRYMFGTDYIKRCLEFDRSWLSLTLDPFGGIAAGELAVMSDGMLHSYLAGTRTREYADSPGKNATLRLLELADELGSRLNHGGGLDPNDGLEASKRSYCNDAEVFVTHQVICEPDRYAELAANAPQNDSAFFPRYRAAAR
jgi:hypothetical protein